MDALYTIAAARRPEEILMNFSVIEGSSAETGLFWSVEAARP
jgi:hypothetical protein